MSAQPPSRLTEPRRALVLHEQPLVVDLIGLTLNHGVFHVRAARDLAESEAILARWRPHLAVVDMDHDDSTALLARLADDDRSPKRTTPVLGLTRRGDLKTKLHAFDVGVDDILTMPFSPEELLARAIALTRRASGTEGAFRPAIQIAEMEINILTGEVRTGDSVIYLTGIEQSLLYLLASRGGEVVTSDEILGAFWGTDLVDGSDVVDWHIRALRIKLQNDHRHPRFIATVPGGGYRFSPMVQMAGPDSAPAAHGRPD